MKNCKEKLIPKTYLGSELQILVELKKNFSICVKGHNYDNFNIKIYNYNNIPSRSPDVSKCRSVRK